MLESVFVPLVTRWSEVEPKDEPAFDPNSVTPGVIGFVVTFAIALAVVFLIFDMMRRVRRANYREQVRNELDAERAEKPAAASGVVDGRDSDQQNRGPVADKS